MKEALDALRAGKPVLVTDDARRENEGDVVLAADRVTPEWTAWTIRNTSGLLCAPMSGARADALELPPMVADNQDPKKTAYTVTVDAAEGVTTGISAADRARTLQVLADPSSSATDLIRPGHVIPLRARPGGVLERPGHTEAAVDLCSLAGVPAVGVIAELVADDGTMMTFPDIERLGHRMQLPVLTIEQVINYRLAHGVTAVPAPRRVERVAETVLTTAHGDFRAIGYADKETGAEHIALVKGELAGSPIARVHSECLTGESFSSQRCECGPQLDAALARVAREGGVVVYLRGHEGRGIGLLKKLAAYRLQDQGFDTMQANLELDELADGREYGGAAAILEDLDVADVRLLTNNPLKVDGLRKNGIAVTAVIPLLVGAAPANVRYLETKRDRMGHLLPGHLEQSM
ncbi:bifunctional 3,4-dihydroxy-2-butanone-4-phosphate synthase/GTP cyclohydrolase II [Rhodococcoides fascians]|uniref:bifunctional 3,4-dihydroxy-2-butanone-4-phosphate synthase/GTP cyclohydrolase II n=1 Tax=Rhodococcoides fascians TaxID=1828 RepID=UPI000561D1C9|nr:MULTISPECIES: bifunctional 3,4-dihydroxy-2-butanone-4-phosphate synthase/GTP cyclohydrolase II [Rhodococcus]